MGALLPIICDGGVISIQAAPMSAPGKQKKQIRHSCNLQKKSAVDNKLNMLWLQLINWSGETKGAEGPTASEVIPDSGQLFISLQCSVHAALHNPRISVISHMAICLRPDQP
jgi:hypothetical protein